MIGAFLMMFGASACTLAVQKPLAPGPDFAGPQLKADHVVSFDGAVLPLQTWAPEDEPWAVMVAVHGMSEYADAFYLIGPWLAERGVAVYAYDQRGFGRTEQLGVWGGELFAQDARTVADLVRARHPNATLAILGESMGAATVMQAADLGEGPIADRVILVAPGVRGWKALPIHYKLSLAIVARVAGPRAVQPPKGVGVQASDNLDALYKNGRDPLFLRQTRFDALHGLITHMQRASETTPGDRAPTLFLYGAKDELIPLHAAEAAASRLGPCGRSALYEEGWHMLLRDQQREIVWEDLIAYLRDPEAVLPSGAPVVGKDMPRSAACDG